MKTKTLTILLATVALSSLLLLGCSAPQSTLTSIPTSTTVVSSPYPKDTSTSAATQMATPLPSSTPIPPISSPTPTMTLTSLPTLTAVERLAFTQELFLTNSGCMLPCWWSITPGVSNWLEVEVFLNFIGAKTSPQILNAGYVYHSAGGFDLVVSESTITNRFGFLEREGGIELIAVRSDGYGNPVAFQEQWALFSPKRIIEKYGAPSRVWLESSSSGPVTEDRVAGYTLWLYYDQFGFLILYNGYGEFAPTFHFCPRFENGKDIRSLKMYLQSPVNPNPVEVTAGIIGLEIDPFPEVQSIEEATSISVTEFYNLFAQEEMPACFDTPRDIWP